MASVPLGVSLLSPPSLAGHGSSPKAPLSALQWDGERTNSQSTALEQPGLSILGRRGQGELSTLQVPPQAGNSP